MTAEHERVRVLDRHAELFRNEGPKTRRVEHARHPQHALAREARCLDRDVAHGIERVGDHDQDRVRREAHGLLHHRPHDPRVLRQEIVPTHARLPRQPRGHDNDIGAGRIGVIVRAEDPCIVADHRRRLGEIQALARRQPFDDVDQHEVGQARLGDALGGRCAHVPGADHGDLVACHRRLSPWPNTFRP